MGRIMVVVCQRLDRTEGAEKIVSQAVRLTTVFYHLVASGRAKMERFSFVPDESAPKCNGASIRVLRELSL